MAEARRKGVGGFSVIELAVTLAVIAVLLMAIVPHFLGVAEEARRDEVRQEARSIAVAIESLRASGEYEPEASLEVATAAIESFVGSGLGGELASLRSDGGFIYGKEISGMYFSVEYVAADGSLLDRTGS